MATMNKRGIFGAPVRMPYDPRMATGAIPDQPFPGSTTPLGVKAIPGTPVPNNGNAFPMDEQPMTTLPDSGSIFAGANPSIRKPHAFEPGGMGRNIIGGLGDALSTWSGGQATFAQGQMMRQKEAYARSEADRQRAAEFADWTHKQDYEAAHPKPENQPEIIDLARIVNDPQRPAYERAAAKARMDAMNDPVITTPGGGMTLRSTVASQLSGGASGPPPAAVDMLRKDPSLIPQFEQKYGPGSAQQYLSAGGRTSSTSATFPIR
jgi:hypothetical protein